MSPSNLPAALVPAGTHAGNVLCAGISELSALLPQPEQITSLGLQQNRAAWNKGSWLRSVIRWCEMNSGDEAHSFLSGGLWKEVNMSGHIHSSNRDTSARAPSWGICMLGPARGATTLLWISAPTKQLGAPTLLRFPTSVCRAQGSFPPPQPPLYRSAEHKEPNALRKQVGKRRAEGKVHVAAPWGLAGC